MDIQPLDEEYEERMLQFEVDCNEGKGNAVACHQVGEFLSVVRNDHDKAAKVYKKNCEELHHAPSCFNLGRISFSPRAAPARFNPVEDVVLAEAPVPTAPVGIRSRSFGVTGLFSRPRRAALPFSPTEKKTSPRASRRPSSRRTRGCCTRSKMVGKGIKQSDVEAAKSFDTACKGDHQPACYHLGFLLLHGGDGVKQDPKKAMKALESSCEGGLADGCHLLATQLLRRDGKGPAPRDPPRARSMLERGCEHQHGPSCFNLAVMYKNGDDGVPSDDEKFRVYKARTYHLVEQYGGLGGIKGA